MQAEERKHGQDHHDEADQIDYAVHKILPARKVRDCCRIVNGFAPLRFRRDGGEGREE
jgi:hypothetical protein